MTLEEKRDEPIGPANCSEAVSGLAKLDEQNRVCLRFELRDGTITPYFRLVPEAAMCVAKSIIDALVESLEKPKPA